MTRTTATRPSGCTDIKQKFNNIFFHYTKIIVIFAVIKTEHNSAVTNRRSLYRT